MDDGTAAVPFSVKLASSENWSIEFTKRAIEEYKKFILLCCISEKGASPSRTVDEVWHLHLTYTQSYWIDFCRNTLGKDIHHYPSAGGDLENHKHLEWYKETLQLYHTVFGAGPPVDIWPPPTSDPQVPEEPPIVWHRYAVLALVIILLLPFIFIGLAYKTLSPFSLGGPHFLVFFPLYGAALLAGYILHRSLIKKKIEEVAIAYFPDDVTAFQMADFLYGKHRALQACIVDLINRDMLEVTQGDFFVVKKAGYRPAFKEKNPLLPAYDAASAGSPYTYETMLGNWYDRATFSHPALQALDEFIRRPESLTRAYLFHAAFLGLLLARTIQAMVNQRPFVFLWLEAAGLLLLFYVTAKFFSKKSVVSEIVKQRWQERAGGEGDMVKQFALDGAPAMNGWTQGALLTGIFAVYTPANNWSSSDSSSSSDSGGSSCGGSSCGGGGGCGGCSGSN